jgi:hypothetical protein
MQTPFIAANTLVKLDRPEDQDLSLQSFQYELRLLRSRFFNAQTPEETHSLVQAEQSLRRRIADQMISNRWPVHSAQQVAGFDLSRSNTFFDPEWSFGITESFDLILGNPPYVPIKQISENDKRTYQSRYRFATGRFNLFTLFIERTQSLLCRNGIACLIVPDRLLLNVQCRNLRDWLLKEQSILELVSLNDSVFESAVVDSVILTTRNSGEQKPRSIRVKINNDLTQLTQAPVQHIPISYFIESPNHQFNLNYDPAKQQLINTIRQDTFCLGSISEIRDGIIQSKIADVLFLSEPVHDFCRKLLIGKDINRCQLHFHNRWVNYQPDAMKQLERERGGDGLRLRSPSIFERPKILSRQTADRIIGTLDDSHYYYSNTLHGTAVTDSRFQLKYVLALLNSSVLNYYYHATTSEHKKVFAQIKIELLRKLPIKLTSMQQPFVTLIDYLLFLNGRCDEIRLFFEHLIDYMTCELYLPSPVKAAGCELLASLGELPVPGEDWDDNRKQCVIEETYHKLSDPNHPVCRQLQKMSTIDEIQLIESSSNHSA